MFPTFDGSVSFPELEQRILGFWRDRRIYEKSLAAREGCPEFVFYEGPPTANGLPHPGHCLTRAIKDLFPRYRTMRGQLCRRKAGWDTHGLPVEVEVCKELGIHSKEEIVAFGVEPFIHKCVESVFRYTRQWEEMTERLGFWIHLDDAYVTYHQSYVESVWWALKTLFDRGLLYQGHKIVWWWAQGGTALSSGEVGQGYREVADPSVYVRFPLVDPPEELADADLLVWTTTPWTLPSNQFAAVDPYLEYSVVDVEGERRQLIIASDLVETIEAKIKRRLLPAHSYRGSDLLHLRYRPPFDCYYESLKNVTQDLYQPQEDERWANYPLLYASNILHLSDKKADEFLRQPRPVGWHIIPADFVTTDTGTGIVHIAPAFGEDDFELLKREQQLFGPRSDAPPLLCPVGSDGKFSDEVPDYQGRWVKDTDRDLIRELREKGLLFHQEQYRHEYPFCWRAEEDPLIQYPRQSWFIRTTEYRGQMLANNSKINWLPEHIKDGRMGNFLESNVDWALSRERYWGTPLPIWQCEETGYSEAVASYAGLLAKPGVRGTEAWDEAKRMNPNLPEDLKVHKPYIDQITYDSPKTPGARMRRVSEVIDCWFDSGAMPFAQWGYPAQPGSAEQFRSQFPADFISEALDQTRGWFYSQLAISTILFGPQPLSVAEILGSRDKGELLGRVVEGRSDRAAAIRHADALSKSTESTHEYPHPFRNCIVLGLMLGEDGQKMSKSKRNYREPREIFDRYGADALRWYLFANQPPWTSIRYSEQAIRECIPEFLLRLWNCYSFFAIYANIDQFDPAAAISGTADQLAPGDLARAKGYRPVVERAEIDRWILGESHRAAAAVTEAMDAYDNYGACARLNEFVDALSNWYVRSCRDRFWSGEMTRDKADAYWTLYECLVTTTKLIAPFTPFLAEALWQNLVAEPFGPRARESVHLCDYPVADAAAIDETLSEQMALVREIVSLGRSARMGAKLKVRQPLARVEMILTDQRYHEWLERHETLICDELNVKQAEIAEAPEQYITYTVLPNLKQLGPRLGKNLPAVRKALAAADGGKLLAELEAEGKITLVLPGGEVSLDREDIQIRLQAKEGWAAAQGKHCVVVLATDLTDELIAEGYARELVRAIQDRRKEIGCEYTDRIAVGIATDSPELRAAAERFADYIRGETLATQFGFKPIAGAEPAKLDVAGFAVTLCVKVNQQ